MEIGQILRVFGLTLSEWAAMGWVERTWYRHNLIEQLEFDHNRQQQAMSSMFDG